MLPVRLHGLRGERSNVPREARYFTERGWMLKVTTMAQDERWNKRYQDVMEPFRGA